MLHDLRYAVRTLSRAPVTALVAILSLAIGLAAPLTVLSWLDALVSRPLSAVPGQGGLVVIDGRTVSGRDQRLSYPDVRDIADQATKIDGIAAYTYQPFALSTADHAERVWGQLVSANFFDVLRVRPRLGKGFSSADEVEGAGAVVVISDAIWRRKFDMANDVIGRVIVVNGHSLTIVGVAPPGFHGVAVGLMLDLWIPVGMQPLLGGGQPNRLQSRDTRWLGAYGRLAPEASISTLRHELDAIASRLAAAYPGVNEGTSFTANWLADAPWGGTTVVKPVLMALTILAVILLVVTCANVANLLLVRALQRRREIAARIALGASRWRVTRQLLAESLLLGSLAACAAAVAAIYSERLFTAMLPPTGFPIGFRLSVNAGWLLMMVALTMVAVALVGLAPVLHARSTPIGTIVREESTAVVTAGRRALLQKALVSAQVSLCVVLLTISGMLLQTLNRAREANTGFDTEHVLLASVDFSQTAYTPQRALDVLRRLPRSLQSIPGVKSASFAQRVPLDFGGRGLVTAVVEGHTPVRGEEMTLALNAVGPEYLRTMGILLREGREFTLQDDESSERIAIVNTTAARLYWPDGRALSGFVTINGIKLRVVGVSGDFRQDSITNPALPGILVPLAQWYRPGVVVHVAAAGDPATLVAPLREAIRSIDPGLPLYDVRTMRQHLEVPTFPYRLGSSLSLVFGAIALLLASLGLYASVSYSIGRRRAELGVRMALGAGRRDVIRLVARDPAWIVAIGMITGSALAFSVKTGLQRVVDGIEMGGAANYLAPLAFVAATCLLAVALSTRRLLFMTPIVALRER